MWIMPLGVEVHGARAEGGLGEGHVARVGGERVGDGVGLGRGAARVGAEAGPGTAGEAVEVEAEALGGVAAGGGDRGDAVAESVAHRAGAIGVAQRPRSVAETPPSRR
jgi:hypothetical protein